MILIEEKSPAAVASVTFTGFAATYKQLYLVFYGSTAVAATIDTLALQLNGDSGANYSWQKLRGTVSTASATEDTSHTYIDLGVIAGATLASTSSMVEIIIPGYATTTFHKSVRAKSSVRATTGSGGMILEETAGFWASTAAITSILVGTTGANFTTGTKIALYGMP